MIKLNKRPSLFRRENAQTMVEFALVFPIILLITYGIIEFGRLVFTYAMVNTAAREGARYGSASGIVNCGGVDKPQYACCSGIQAAAERRAILTDVSSITISFIKGLSTDPAHETSSTCSDVYSQPKKVGTGDRIRVTVVAQFTPWISFVGLDSINIESTNFRTILVDVPIEAP
jgi:Flp pilus assembly protein TadG